MNWASVGTFIGGLITGGAVVAIVFSRLRIPQSTQCTCHFDDDGGPYGRPHWNICARCEVYRLEHHDDLPPWSNANR